MKHVPILLVHAAGLPRRWRREEKRAVMERLDELLDQAARFCFPLTDPWQAWTRRHRGHRVGYYVVFKGCTPAVAAEYTRRLGAALPEDGPDTAQPGLRLRLVLDLGDVERVGDQYLAEVFQAAETFCSCPDFKRHAAHRAEPWALVRSQLFAHELARDEERHKFPQLLELEDHWRRVEVVDDGGELQGGWVLGTAWAPPQTQRREEPDATTASPGPSSSPTAVDWDPYLEALVRHTSHLEIKGIQSGSGRVKEARRVRIEEIYTPLRSRPMAHLDPQRRPLGALGALGDLGGLGEEPVPLAALLPQNPRLLIVGQPGAGKTTFARLVASLLARDRLGQRPPSGESWRRRYLGLKGPARLPILLRVSDVVRVLTAPGAPALRFDSRQWILDALDRLCEDNGWVRMERRHWEELLSSDGGVLLLDGLDEVADPALRQRIFTVFEDACENWRCPMVVTSRPLATGRLVEMGFHPAEIAPFGETEIRLFLDRWVAALYEVGNVAELDATGERYRQSLSAAIVKVPGVRRLAANPVMMTCLCVVHRYEGRLPEGRSRVYSAVIRWLLHSRTEPRTAAGFSEGFARKALARLALAMVNGSGGKRPEIGVEEAAEAVAAVVERHFRDSDAEDQRRLARRWLRQECLWSGILEEGAGQRLRFWHLTFEEFLAAQQLAWRRDQEDDADEDWWPVVRRRLDDPQWREVVDLLPVCLYDEGGEKRVDTFLERVLALRKEGDLVSEARVAGIVGRILQPLSLDEVDYEPRPDLAGLCSALRRRTLALFEVQGAAQVPAELRIQAAEALGQGGDPRFAQGAQHWIQAPGSAAGLAKYLVTVEEYGRFVDDGGYGERRHWSPTGWKVREKEGWEAPGSWDEQLTAPNRPVVRVSWWEAEAYCGWLSALLGREIRLPTGEEWLGAASPDGRKYPWGEDDPDPERANFGRKLGEGYVGHPTPVGVYPTGDGALGHCDLAGNVWEWSADARDDGRPDDDPDKRRVLRGGGWSGPAPDLLAAIRYDWGARDRGDDVGFRVCCAALDFDS